MTPNFGGSDIGSQLLPNRKSRMLCPPNSDSASLSRNKNIETTNTITTKPLSLMHVSIKYSLILLCNSCVSYGNEPGFLKLLLAFRTESKIYKKFGNVVRLTVGIKIQTPRKRVFLALNVV